MFKDITKTVRGGLAASNQIITEVIMSHTIRNERTRGYLDKLERRRVVQRLARDMKAINLQDAFDQEDYLDEINFE